MAYSGSFRPYRERAAEGERPVEIPVMEPKKQAEKQGDKRPEPPQSPLSIQNILKKIEAAGLETDDLLLALVLFLMYRESGDKDLLILLGAMLLS